MRSASAHAVVVGLALCFSAPAAAVYSEAPSPATEQASADIRHVVLLLDSGPLHLQLRVTIDGTSLTAAREQYVRKLLKRLDRDGDGQLNQQEASQSPLLRQPELSNAAAFLQELRSEQRVTVEDVMRTVHRVAGESVVYRQDESASESDRYVFDLLDEDGSGVIDRREMATAAARLADRDADRDESVGFDEIQPPPPEPPSDEILLAVATQTPARPRATFSEILRDAREPLLPRRLLRKYDDDGNGRLSALELGWPEDRLAVIDQDGNGDASEAELENLAAAPVDLALAIDIDSSAGDESRLIVEGGAAVDEQTVQQPGLVRIALADATLAVTYRHVDPIAEAVDDARRRLNQLDIDGNGYLDAEEARPDVRLRRGLFDMIDADDDGKVFGEEVEAFVRMRGEPDALTCRVNLYDTGSGFFQSLDVNNDGRISVREMRDLDDSLRRLDRNSDEALSPREPPRHFHLEFVRGGYRLFGPTDQMVSSLPAFNRGVAVGPIWFQRMDRNNDGDLTWREFLGHREDFHLLDADGDHLIDPREAMTATAMHDQ